tara:strand:+ start:228 stop:830 length:603 start_codon:yes stop_codon:yes gene_type:complete
MAIIRANNNTLSSVTSLPSGVGGNLVLVSDTTISNGATLVVLGPLTTYDKYIVELIDINHSTSGGAILRVQYGTDASTYNNSSNYSYAMEMAVYDDAQYTSAKNTDTQFDLTWDAANQWGGDDNTNAVEGQMMVYGKQRSTTNTYPSLIWNLRGTHPSGNGGTFHSGAGYLKVNSAFTHIFIYLSTGSFTRGKVKLYGLN